MDELVRKTLEEEYGLKIGRYLGRGGFARVYEAESAQGVRCAVKVSLDRLDGSGQGMQKQNQALQKELKNLRLVQTITGHPHVVTLMDYWVIDGYLVTRWELATEGSLADLLAKHVQEGTQGIPLDCLLRYTYEAADAIDFLNGQGIYHRDIKPENLLLFHGHVKVADLGLAKFAGASTASHTGSGTLGYLPPEATKDHRLTKTVDLYSLAATYVKLRTGSEPFGTNVHEIVNRQKGGNPLTKGLGQDEADWVRRALAFRPEDRPQEGAVAWVRGLYEAVRSKRTPKYPQAPPRKTGIEAISVESGRSAASLGCVAQSHRLAANGKLLVPAIIVSVALFALLGVFAMVFGAILQRPKDRQLEQVPVDPQAPTTDGDRVTVAPPGPRDSSIDEQALGNGQEQQGSVTLTPGDQELADEYEVELDEQLPTTAADPINAQPTSAVISPNTRKIGPLASIATLLAATTPDGRGAVSASWDGTLCVWDLESGECSYELRGHTQSVTCLAITPNGRRAVSGSEDCTLRVWDLESGECSYELRGHTQSVTCLAITPNGRRAVSGSEDCTLRVWDLDSGACLHELRGHTQSVMCLAITPNGRRAVSGSEDCTLRVWDLDSGACLHELCGHTQSVSCLAITPDSRSVISGSLDHTLREWDLECGVCLGALLAHTTAVLRLAITPDGRRAISASWDSTLRVWNLVTIASLHELRGHSDWAWCLAITPDSRRAVSGGLDSTLRVWDLESGVCLHQLRGHKGWVWCAAITPDGRRAISGSWDQTLRVWDLETGACLDELCGHTDKVWCLAITPDGRYALSGGMDGLRVWALP